MKTAMRRAVAVFVPSFLAGVVLYFGVLRPGYGIVLLIVAIALFAAGGVNEANRLLWVPFALVGALLAAINFAGLSVPPALTGSLLVVFGVASLVSGAAIEWLGGR